MRRRAIRLVAPLALPILAIAALWPALMPAQSPAYAAPTATISVTTTADEVNTNGSCSLREAIINANNDDQSGSPDCTAGSGRDTVLLGSGTYTLSIPGTGEDVALSGDLDLSADIVISGVSSTTTTIAANGLDRILHVVSSAANVELSNLTLVGGQVADRGGAVYNGGTLTITNVIVTGNRTIGNYEGGGVYNGGSGTMLVISATMIVSNTAGQHGGGLANNAGTIIVNDSRLSQNLSGLGHWGGAIYNLNGTVHMRGATVRENTSQDEAGGIGNNGNAATSFLTDTLVISNTAIRGGAIYNNNGNVVLYRVTLADNSALTDGGAVYNRGSSANITVSRSKISANTSNSDNDNSGSGGGFYNSNGSLTLDSSTLNGNRALGASRSGGAIYNTANLNLTNSTVSSNWAGGHGAGVYLNGGTAVIGNSTVVSNTADGDADSFGDGGGIYREQGTVSIGDTILAYNQDLTGEAPNCAGAITSSDFNLVANTTGCAIGFLSGDLTGIDPQLGPLQDNGGDTDTHALLMLSPAVGQGSCGGGAVSTDQRGVSRPLGAACDIGAYEYDGTPFVSAADDLYGKVADRVLAIAAPGVLDNDATFDVISATLNSGPAVGSVDLRTNGAFTYTPPLGFAGVVTFTYDASDGANVATAEVTLAPAPCAASHDDGTTVFSSIDARALQDAIDAATDGDTVKVAGRCTGVTAVGGQLQTANIAKSISVAGAYTFTNWITPWPLTQTTTLDAEESGRVAYISSGYDVSFQDLTLTGGQISDHGGAVYVGGTLTMTDVIISGNSTTGDNDGGAMYVAGGSASATLINITVTGNSSGRHGGAISNSSGSVTIQGSSFSNNASGPGDWGGAIFNLDGWLDVRDSTFTQNTSQNAGGAIGSNGSTSVVAMTSTLMISNTASRGGGIYISRGSVNLTLLTISGNEATGDGGGILVSSSPASLNVISSTVSYNVADLDNDNSGHGGGIYNNDGNVMVSNSTINGNTARGTDRDGGGLFNTNIAAVLKLVNSTVTGNGASGHGGGIYNGSGVTELYNTTVVSNTADSDGNDAGDGGGLYHNGGVLFITDTIAANNNDVSGQMPECGGAITSGDYNLVENPAGCAFGALGNDVTGIDPILSPLLVDNGGDTDTHALLSGSPAIGQGNCSNGTLTADQRGITRPQGATCDIGAVEFGGPAFIDAREDVFAKVADLQLIVPAPGTLDNDPSVNPITASLSVGPAIGSLDLRPTGAFTYTPPIGFSGVVTFSYTASDGANADTAVVTLRPAACVATPDDGGTLFGSTNATAAQDAVDAAAPGATVKVAGSCAGVEAVSGHFQSVNIVTPLTIAGGYTFTNWSTAYPITQPTVIDAASAGRVAYVNSGIAVTFRDMTLTGGQSATPGGAVFIEGQLTMANMTLISNTTTGNNDGGAVYVANSAARLTVLDSTLTDNTSGQHGGAIAINAGRADIIGSLLSRNLSGSGNWGGAVYNLNGTLTISDTVVSFNTGQNSGGGIGNNGAAATALLTNTLLISNTATRGGAIFNGGGFVDLSSMSIWFNNALADGGALFNDQSTASFNVFNSVIANNTADSNGDNIGSGGAMYNSNGDVSYSFTTIVANRTLGTNRAGGAIYSTGDSTNLSMLNTTVSGNAASGHGGGLFSNSGSVDLQNSTVASNTADADNDGFGDAGGIYRNNGAVTIEDTVLANNIDNGGQSPDCYGAITSAGFNLVESTQNCIFGAIASDFSGHDPRLGPLQNNGGDTETHALLASSRAIGQGNCSNNSVVIDQRGVARPQGVTCDIGAYEFDGSSFVSAFDDTYAKVGDIPFVMPAPGVLDNDSTLNPITASLSAAPSIGSVDLSSSGAFTYTPPLGFTGVVTFSYEATDGVTIDAAQVTLQPAVCSATPDDGGTLFGSTNATAVQDAVDAAAPSATVKVAGHCAGVKAAGGHFQSVNIVTPLTIAGGYTFTNWSTAYPITQPTVIDAASAGRVAYVNSGIAVTFRDMTFTGGQSAAPGGAVFIEGQLTMANMTLISNTTTGNNDGGAVYVANSAARLTALDSTLTDNTSGQHGGAIAINAGRADIRGSLLSRNLSGSGNWGGAVYNLNGTLTISDTVVSFNTGQNSGGGIGNNGAAATALLTNTLLISNTATRGGAILNRDGDLGLSLSSLSFNSASADGGAIYSDGNPASLTLVDSIVAHNTADSDGDNTGHGGALFNLDGDADLRQSTFNLNQVLGTSRNGGAIYNTGNAANLNMTNVTLSGNSASGHGGAVHNNGGTSAALNVTIVGNIADSDGNDVGDGGGLYRNAGILSISNTILSANSDVGGQAPDCSGNVSSSDHNLLTDTTGCGIVVGANDIVGIDPLLGGLIDNGGATSTHAPRIDSAAVGGGNCPGTPVTDQRGMGRTNPGCDIGAFEVQVPADTHVQVCGLQTGQDYYFGVTGVQIRADALGTLSCVDVMIVNQAHPSAIPSIPAPYVIITPTPTTAANYALHLTMFHTATTPSDATICRFPRGAVSGGWDCAKSAYSDSTVSRLTTLIMSDWSVGYSVMPTAVTLRSFKAIDPGWAILAIVVGARAASLVAVVWLETRRRKRRRP